MLNHRYLRGHRDSAPCLCYQSYQRPPSFNKSEVVLTIRCNKSPIHLCHSLTTILQGLRHIMRPIQWRILFKQHIVLSPHSIPSMICDDVLDTVHDRSETVGQVGQFLLQGVVDRGTGEAGYVFEGGGAPVVYYKEREEASANCKGRRRVVSGQV